MLFLDFIIRSLRLKICKKQCGLVCLAGCVCIQTQEMIAHVVMDSYQACLIGCCYRNIDLCVISIAVIGYVVFFGNVIHKQQVASKQEWAEYGSLWNTTFNLRARRHSTNICNNLCLLIRLAEPGESLPSMWISCHIYDT